MENVKGSEKQKCSKSGKQYDNDGMKMNGDYLKILK